MQIHEVTPGFAAMVENFATGQMLDPKHVDTIVAALNEFGVIVVRPAGLSPQELSAFARQFGPIADVAGAGRIEDTFVITNVEADGSLWAADNPVRRNSAANEYWHSDNTYSPRRALYSMLQGEIVPPEGGATEFANMSAAYAELPDELKKRVEGLQAVHSILHSRKLTGFTEWTEEQLAKISGSVIRPLVSVHPLTGKRCLCLASHISEILGLPDGQSEALLAELRAFATQDRFLYRHEWRVNDLLIWDNVTTMHRATPFDDLRFARRVRSIRVLDIRDPVAQQADRALH